MYTFMEFDDAKNDEVPTFGVCFRTVPVFDPTAINGEVSLWFRFEDPTRAYLMYRSLGGEALEPKRAELVEFGDADAITNLPDGGVVILYTVGGG